MKCFWLAGMMVCSLTGLAQQNTQTVTNSNNSRNAAPAVADSVQVIEEKRSAKPASVESRSLKKKTQVEINREDELNISAPPANNNKDADGMYNAPEVELAVPAATIQMQQQFQLNQTNSTRQYSRRSASAEEQVQMEQSVRYYKANSPGSFESHFYTYLTGHYNWALYPELEAAAKMQPHNQEVIQQQAAYFIMTQASDRALESIEQLIHSNKLTPEHLDYAKDVLISGTENGVIVFHGFEDMLSAYYVQQKQAIRADVKLLSLDFLQSQDYQRSWTDSENLHFPYRGQIDTAFLREFCQLNQGHNIQIAMTVPKDYFLPMRGQLYPVGLTFLYSEVPVDYFERNKQLWYDQLRSFVMSREDAKSFALEVHNDKDASGSVMPVVDWSKNYLPMMITLRDQLEKSGEKQKADELSQQIQLLKP